jgi:ABC-2 type transport system ATP-binding protein
MSILPIVEIAGLRKAFGDISVLDGIDLTVETGSVVALLGPNGAGKTTTVNILSTLVRPDSGTARVGGHDVVRAAGAVRNLISLTGQSAAVDGLLTGRENLVLMAKLGHLPRRTIAGRVDELLDRFELGDAQSRLVRTYSGGMRRRLDLAIGLLAQPQLLVLDEPTTGLDPRSRQGVWRLVRELVADGVSVLLTTQYLEEADQLADRVAVVDHGRIIAEGTPEDLKRTIGSDRVEVIYHDGARASVPTDGSVGGLRRVLADIEAADRPVYSVDLRRPSLDDVFLALTGQPAGRDPAPGRDGPSAPRTEGVAA